MQREPLSKISEHPQLLSIFETFRSGRYFNNIDPELLKNMLRQGTVLTLKKDDYLIKEGDDSPTEMYILVEGSLAVISQDKFILRLDLPGDVVGEAAVIHSGPRSADVIAETDCMLIAFSAEMFEVEKGAKHAPIFYVLCAHVLAAKLRITTAQSLIRKNERTKPGELAKIAIIDENEVDRLLIRGIVEVQWPEAILIEYEKPQHFIDNPLEYRFDLIIVDVLFSYPEQKQQKEVVGEMFKIMKDHGAFIYVISELCNEYIQRHFLMSEGAVELHGKPYSAFDVKHSVIKFRLSYLKDKELDKVEHDADTDRLTGLANRRRMDEFIEALVTLYSDNNQGFSLIISDIDHFKNYNDTQGHQMGDVVLAGVATLFSNNVRRGDLAARFGGEEFVMVLPNCDKSAAITVAEKLRNAVEKEVFPYQEQQPLGNLTATFGVASFPEAPTVEALLKQADDCLYQGKEGGRNIVIASNSPVESEK